MTYLITTNCPNCGDCTDQIQVTLGQFMISSGKLRAGKMRTDNTRGNPYYLVKEVSDLCDRCEDFILKQERVLT